MGLFDVLKAVVGHAVSSSNPGVRGAIDYGGTKIGGGHDHRYNTGADRTPAQKAADEAKRKD